MVSNLSIDFLGKEFKNPIVAASGTFGFGREYNKFFDVSKLGGICSKGLTLNAQLGNTGERIFESSGGVINSIGLENPGVKTFIDNELEFMQELNTNIIVNYGAHSIEDFIEGIELLNNEDIDFIELNISCPNVKEGGMAFCMEEESAYNVTKKSKNVSKHKIIVKLSPNAPSIVNIAKAVEEAGADALSLVNTFLAMAIDINKKKPVFDNTYAGLSGPAIKPIALRMVHQVAQSTNIPILSYGGVRNYIDAIEFIMAGATLVGVGSSIFENPLVMLEIIDGIENYMKKNNIKNLEEIRKII